MRKVTMTKSKVLKIIDEIKNATPKQIRKWAKEERDQRKRINLTNTE